MMGTMGGFDLACYLETYQTPILIEQRPKALLKHEYHPSAIAFTMTWTLGTRSWGHNGAQ